MHHSRSFPGTARIATGSLLIGALLLTSRFVASQSGPTAAVDIPNEAIEAVLDSPDGGTDRQIRVVDMGAFNLAVGILHRGPTGDEDSPPIGVLHTDLTETYVIRSGSGTLITGGTITEPSDFPTDSHLVRNVVGPSVFGPSEGGRARRVEPGDVIIVPAGMVHAWTDIEDHVTYLSIRPDPDKLLRAGYVNPAVE